MDLADGCSENAELCGCECVGRPVIDSIDCWPAVDCASEQDEDTSGLVCCDTDSSLCEVADVPGPLGPSGMDCPSAWGQLQQFLGLTSCLKELAFYCPVTCGVCPAAENTKQGEDPEQGGEEDGAVEEVGEGEEVGDGEEDGEGDQDEEGREGGEGEESEKVVFDNDYYEVMSSYGSVDTFLVECTRAVRSIRSSCTCDSVTRHPQTHVISITMKGQSESVNAVASKCRRSGLKLNHVQLSPHIEECENCGNGAERESSAFGLISSTAIFVVLLGCM